MPHLSILLLSCRPIALLAVGLGSFGAIAGVGLAAPPPASVRVAAAQDARLAQDRSAIGLYLAQDNAEGDDGEGDDAERDGDSGDNDEDGGKNDGGANDGKSDDRENGGGLVAKATDAIPDWFWPWGVSGLLGVGAIAVGAWTFFADPGGEYDDDSDADFDPSPNEAAVAAPVAPVPRRPKRGRRREAPPPDPQAESPEASRWAALSGPPAESPAPQAAAATQAPPATRDAIAPETAPPDREEPENGHPAPEPPEHPPAEAERPAIAQLESEPPTAASPEPAPPDPRPQAPAPASDFPEPPPRADLPEEHRAAAPGDREEPPVGEMLPDGDRETSPAENRDAPPPETRPRRRQANQAQSSQPDAAKPRRGFRLPFFGGKSSDQSGDREASPAENREASPAENRDGSPPKTRKAPPPANLPARGPRGPAPAKSGDPLAVSPTRRMARPSAVDRLMADLRSPNAARRRHAIWELGQRGEARAIQALVDLMVDGDSQQRSLVLAALSEIGTRTLKPVSKVMALSLQDDNPQVRLNAIRDLAQVYDQIAQIGHMLYYATDDRDPEVQKTARWALDRLKRLRTAADRAAVPRSSDDDGPDPEFADEPDRLAWGRSLAASGQLAEATQVLQAAVARDPDDPDAQAALAGVLAAQGNVGSALAAWAVARARYADAGDRESVAAIDRQFAERGVDPDRAEAHRAAAIVRVNEDDPDGAEAELQQAIALNPYDPEARRALARVCQQRGDRDGAIAGLQQARDLYVERGQAREARQVQQQLRRLR